MTEDEMVREMRQAVLVDALRAIDAVVAAEWSHARKMGAVDARSAVFGLAADAADDRPDGPLDVTAAPSPPSRPPPRRRRASRRQSRGKLLRLVGRHQIHNPRPLCKGTGKATP